MKAGLEPGASRSWRFTMGDPAGVGPEIALKALLRPEVRSLARCIIVGDPDVLFRAASLPGLAARINVIADVADARFDAGTVDVIGEQSIDLSAFRFSAVSAEAGEAAFRAVRRAIELAMSGKVDATVTGPIKQRIAEQVRP